MSQRFVYCFHYFECGLLYPGFLISCFDPTFFVRKMVEGKLGSGIHPKKSHMIMNDDLGEMDSADSLDNESTGSDPLEKKFKV